MSNSIKLRKVDVSSQSFQRYKDLIQPINWNDFSLVISEMYNLVV